MLSMWAKTGAIAAGAATLGVVASAQTLPPGVLEAAERLAQKAPELAMLVIMALVFLFVMWKTTSKNLDFQKTMLTEVAASGSRAVEHMERLSESHHRLQHEGHELHKDSLQVQRESTAVMTRVADNQDDLKEVMKDLRADLKARST